MVRTSRRPPALALAALATLLVLGAAACGGEGGSGGPRAGEPAVIAGTVAYLERIALGPTAEVTVKLVDVSRADAPSTTLAEETTVTDGAQVPIPFELDYDAAAIEERNTYNLQATIVDGGQIMFRTTQAYPVLTRGAPTTDVELILEKTNG